MVLTRDTLWMKFAKRNILKRLETFVRMMPRWYIVILLKRHEIALKTRLGPHSTLDSILASHPAARVWISAKIFSHYCLVCGQYWDWTHLVLKAMNFANAVQRRPKQSSTKKFLKQHSCGYFFLRGVNWFFSSWYSRIWWGPDGEAGVGVSVSTTTGKWNPISNLC